MAQKYTNNFKFTSINNFVDEMNKFEKNIINARLYIEPKATLKSKYSDICAKPIYIILTLPNKKLIYLNHEKILNYFQAQPVICFKRNIKFIKNADLLILKIDFQTLTSEEGYKYHKIFISIERNQNIINKIKALSIQTINENETNDYEDEKINEEEIV